MAKAKSADKTINEVEQALIIRGKNPAAIADNIANLQVLDDFLIVKEPTQMINDSYLNTSDRSIKGSSLRIREVDNNQTLITIKGKNINAGQDKPAKRTELEVEWPWEEISPWDMADLFDLSVIQDRTTKRRVRNVISKNQKFLVAELAIDEVCYNFGDEKVRIFEVEVEGRCENSEVVVSTIVEALKKRFPNNLKKWSYSKMATGNLLKIALGVNVNENDVVTDESFDKLEVLFGLI